MTEWNVDPTIFTLGPLSPRWYGVLFATAFLLSYQVMKKIFVTEKKELKDLDLLTIYMIAGTILGARLGHVLFYEPEIVLKNPFELFAIWHGGLASHGGAIGIITGLWLFHRKRKGYSMTWLLDRLAIVAALSGMCIRIGNLFNSEIVGRPTDVPWAFWFKLNDVLPVWRHPAQVYEALLCLVIFIGLWLLYRKGVAMAAPGRLFGIFLVVLFTGRFLVEFLKEHQVGFEASLPIDMGQILSIPFIAAGVWYLVRSSGDSSRSASAR
ncbi:MAG: prolipoprotein diacylglyceryl transferase [Ignavibacteria bacterium]|nr:prolipoprotein diacylglyceryl transferase [Ignavibacteria bacterium]MBK6419743.1 prolipoprotein diacylglyceryl transferase [Ignavibacteria bacterium]MBK7184518.1 prolipoprotein diacylglyceryl transferase [Ignavibacteria bacterium]MBK7576814.1 prolipoprotein diacylglyceryl transferase [Ignavibacteria bacterium]MBK9181567.1 prolipoprotein diacylglyceryl transferase [Ignavibacteria bacterium]